MKNKNKNRTDKKIDIIDREFRACKAYMRKEITKKERDKIVKDCENQLKKIDLLMN